MNIYLGKREILRPYLRYKVANTSDVKRFKTSPAKQKP